MTDPTAPTPDEAAAQGADAYCPEGFVTTQAYLLVLERNAALRAEVERAREELAQADRFGRGEFRVTTWAYDQAVRVMHEAKARASAVADAVRAQHPREVIGEFTWCSGCTLPNARSHVEWPCPTIRSLDAALGPVETPQEDETPWFRVGNRPAAHHVRVFEQHPGLLTTDCGNAATPDDIADPRPGQLRCKVCERDDSYRSRQPSFVLPEHPDALDLDAALTDHTATDEETSNV